MFLFFCCFFLCNTNFLTNCFLYSYMTISSHVNISSKIFTKKHYVRSEKIYFLLYSQNDSDSNPTGFLSLSCHYGSSYIVMNFSPINAFPIESHMSKNTPYFHQSVLSSPNFWGLTWLNICPLHFIKPNKYPFNTIALPSSLIRPHRWPLNEFNFIWYYVFEIRSLINWSSLETIIVWWHFDIAIVIFQTSSSIFSNGYGKPLHCTYATWCLTVAIICDISVFIFLIVC